MLAVDEFLKTAGEIPHGDLPSVMAEFIRLVPGDEQVALALRFGQGTFPAPVERALLAQMDPQVLLGPMAKQGAVALLGCLNLSADHAEQLAWNIEASTHPKASALGLALCQRYPEPAFPILLASRWAQGGSFIERWTFALAQWLVREPTAEAALLQGLAKAVKSTQHPWGPDAAITLYRTATQTVPSLKPPLEALWVEAFPADILALRLAEGDVGPEGSSVSRKGLWSESLVTQMARWANRPDQAAIAQQAMRGLDRHWTRRYKVWGVAGRAPHPEEFCRPLGLAILAFLDREPVSPAWRACWKKEGPLQQLLVAHDRVRFLKGQPATSDRPRRRS